VNPRQRRGALLIVVAAIGAVGVFFLGARYLSDVRSQLGPMVTVIAAAEDLPPFATPDASSLLIAEVPQRWLPPNSFTDTSQIGDRVTAAAVPAGTVLSAGMFLDRPAIEPGEREIAILVDAETGVGGKLTSGAVVDIFATFAGTDDEPPSVRIVVQRAEIIEVGSPVDATQDGFDRGSVGFASSERLPVTFRLSVEDARTLAFVESFATSVRLALRSPLDDDILPGGVSVFIPRGDDLGRQINPVPRAGRPTDPAPDEPADPDPRPEPDEAADEPEAVDEGDAVDEDAATEEDDS
jgi:Flp pilus assembly protein CpaB